MVQLDENGRRERIGSAIGVAVLHAGLAYALLTATGVATPAGASSALKLFDVAEQPPPPPDQPLSARAKRAEREGAASPPNLKSRPSPVVAPPPRIRLGPPVALAAPKPAEGQEVSAGASDREGAGSGSGGIGAGNGSGRGGNGTGGGVAKRARLVAGRIFDSDYPPAASRARATGTATVRLSVGASGRVTSCTIVRSSSHADLDSATCRLAQARFRYSPARDAQGRPVADVVGWQQAWWQEPR